ncbi:hypothetical protein [Chondromyces apiculatus]|uniref:Uropathogenic specific protein n=1 Tax=Chondromyces apiculatus DSM 436 TaxID=1192034 RepID=A0A017SX02_9BACT|nr:hypothetical protein [Chondromyces apiculatus]EYF01302.1 Uropathogenic specific protein [Chondromyces apiculatus DSM 436]
MSKKVKSAVKGAKGQDGKDAAGKTEEKCPCQLILKVFRKQEWNKKPGSSSENVQQGGTIGDFELWKVGDKEPLVTGKMLEAAGPSSKTRGSDQRVSPGSYGLIKNPGSKGPYRLIQTTQAAATASFGTRGAVNIHGGNNPVDLEGCLLPGSASTTNKVTEPPAKKGGKGEISEYPSISGSQSKLSEIKAQIAKYGTTESMTTYDGAEKYNTAYYNNVTVVIYEIGSGSK